jgi:hypothetical protein
VDALQLNCENVDSLFHEAPFLYVQCVRLGTECSRLQTKTLHTERDDGHFLTRFQPIISRTKNTA